MNPVELTKEIARVLDSKKAVDIKAIETTEVTIIADFFLVASGTSSTHTKSLAEDVEFELEKKGISPTRIEGRATGWVLMDYGSVIVHIFQAESREYYNLERLWTDAALLDLSGILTEN